MLGVVDGSAFAQELRTRDDRNVGVGIGRCDYVGHFVARANWYRRFGYHHGEAFNRRRNFARHGIDIGQVGIAVPAAAGRTNSDDHHLRCRNKALEVYREALAPSAYIGLYQRGEAGFVDQDFASFQLVDLTLVGVDAHPWPKSARQTPVTKPTFPAPTMAIFMVALAILRINNNDRGDGCGWAF